MTPKPIAAVACVALPPCSACVETTGALDALERELVPILRAWNDPAALIARAKILLAARAAQ